LTFLSTGCQVRTMADVISCPSCQRKLQVPESLIGQDVQCPSCGATFIARIGGAAPPSGAPRPQPTRPWDTSRRPEDAGPPQSGSSAQDDFDSEERPRRRDLAPHRGALILTLGLIGIVIWPAAPFAWTMGNGDLKEIHAGRMDPDGEGQVHAGMVCGMIGSIIGGIGAALLCCCCGIPFLNNVGR
jgi:predicted RNA-binding Zn-ribbon protein involved in translation (DUF1610 family)